jgi:hypothetical protein
MEIPICSYIRCISLKRVMLVLGTFLFVASMARAQAPSTIFQLDGNAAPDTAGNGSCIYSGPCDTWNLLNGTGGAGPIGTGSQAGHSSVRTFINGTSTTDSFTGGGSKDANLLSSWAYSGSPTPNKDTLNAGYAAAYNLGDFDIIFGANRASPSGDANIGIWFFQQTVGLNGNGGFTGAHVNGDVFIISAFTGGGGTSTITAYTWDSTCASGVKNPTVNQCADTHLRLLANPTSVCTSTSAECAITNGATTASTWSGNLASPLFFEGGIDITQAFAGIGQAVPCFSSFLEETRSSQSTSAVLKDFLLGGFPVCSMTTSKACGTATANSAGTAFNYPVSGTVTNTGIGTLFNVQVIDTVGTTAHAAISIVNTTTGSKYLNTNNLGAGDIGSWSDSSSSTATSSSDQAQAIAATSSGGAQTLTSNTASATCTATANTTLTVTKSCKTTLQASGGVVSVHVSYGGQVCNAGPSQITGVSLTDYQDSSNTAGTGSVVATGITLAPATSTGPTCVTYGPLGYNPTIIDQTINGNNGVAGDGAGRYSFSDLITISSATPTIGSISKVSTPSDPRTDGTFGYGNATCPICQGAAECTAQ